MRGAIPPLTQYVFMAWYLVNVRVNLNFILPHCSCKDVFRTSWWIMRCLLVCGNKYLFSPFSSYPRKPLFLLLSSCWVCVMLIIDTHIKPCVTKWRFFYTKCDENVWCTGMSFKSRSLDYEDISCGRILIYHNTTGVTTQKTSTWNITAVKASKLGCHWLRTVFILTSQVSVL